MAFVITKPCIGVKDTACIVVCPMDCIHPLPDEAGFADAEMLYINPAECIDCNLCTGECPVTAIFQDADVPADWSHFIARNAAHYEQQGRQKGVSSLDVPGSSDAQLRAAPRVADPVVRSIPVSK